MKQSLLDSIPSHSVYNIKRKCKVRHRIGTIACGSIISYTTRWNVKDLLSVQYRVHLLPIYPNTLICQLTTSTTIGRLTPTGCGSRRGAFSYAEAIAAPINAAIARISTGATSHRGNPHHRTQCNTRRFRQKLSRALRNG